MSLYERVLQSRQARNDLEISQEPILDDLRLQVKECISMESIASIMLEDSERAKNEIRAACRQAFTHPKWRKTDNRERQRLVSELLDTVFGFGPIERLLQDDTVTEIMVNGASRVYYEQQGKIIPSEVTFENDNQVRVLIDRIIGPLGRRIDEASPIVNARLPQGHRVNAVIPPIALDGPTLTIRAFTRSAFTLQNLVAAGSMTECVRQFLIWAVQAKRNIAVAGGTGSGKTTLLNALSCHIDPRERIITIEDSAELKFTEHPHVVRLEARPRNAEGTGEITIRDLVVNSLRMRPDRIIVGECRSAEALDMLQAMLTGHEGSLTTLHAGTPEEVVDRLITMVRYEADLPIDAIEAQIGNAFDLIVQTTRDSDGLRFISHIVEVGFDRTRRRCSLQTLYERSWGAKEGTWLAFPDWFSEIVRRNLASSEEVKAWTSAVGLV